MKRKEELQALKVCELKAICKERGIKHYNGKSCFRKSELIDAILISEEKVNSTTESVKDENCGHMDVSEDKKPVEVDMVQKIPYIEGATKGTLVAFRLPNGKVKSAMVVKKSTQNRKLMVETSYGAQHVIRYDDVVWVRFGKRWPRGVYTLLKGQVEDGTVQS